MRDVSQTNAEPMERLSDVDPEVLEALRQAVLPEIERIEALTGVDLAEWRATDG